MPIGRISEITVVDDATQVGEARRKGAALAASLGFGEEAAGRLAIVITEAGTNLVKHGKGGRIVLNSVSEGAGAGVEVLALDRGPGIADLARSLHDGYSTSGTPGNGLGAIRRIADIFDIYSLPGKGLALFAAVFAQREYAHRRENIGFVQACAPGEDVCGDAWGWAEEPQRLLVALADGLGHGPEAAKASIPALEFLGGDKSVSALSAIQEAHRRLRPTRGAAMAVCEINRESGKVRFAGVGNISASIAGDSSEEKEHHLVSMNGTLGHAARSFQEFSYELPQQALLVLHSDGLNTRWRLADYPALASRHPSLVAGVLYRDHNRDRDDATVVVVRRA